MKRELFQQAKEILLSALSPCRLNAAMPICAKFAPAGMTSWAKAGWAS